MKNGISENIVKTDLRLFYSAVFLRHLALGIIIPTLIIWQNAKGLSFKEIALTQSVGLLVIALTEIPSSHFADLLSRKKIVVSGLWFFTVSFFILLGAKTFFFFLLFQIFYSLGAAFLAGTETAFLHDIVKRDEKKLTRYIGRMSMSDESGTIFGMIISSLFIRFFSMETSFRIAFVSTILAILAVGFVHPVKNEPNVGQATEKSILHFISKITPALFLVIFALAFMGERGEMIFQKALGDTGLKVEYFGYIYVAGKLFAILASRLSHWIENKITSYYALALTALLQAGAFFVVILGSKIGVILSLGLFFFAENIFRNIQQSFVLKKSPLNKRATYLSTLNLSSTVIQMGFRPMVGSLMDVALAYGSMMIMIMKALALGLWLNKSNKNYFKLSA